MSAPCGGCPPCCSDCVFTPIGGLPPPLQVKMVIVVEKSAYGCVRSDGGDIVTINGTLGMRRGKNFHPVTQEGVEFLKKNNNPLAAHCS